VKNHDMGANSTSLILSFKRFDIANRHDPKKVGACLGLEESAAFLRKLALAEIESGGDFIYL
jgi:hypothetical protein